MRQFINYALAAAAVCCMTACDPAAELADNLDGTWSGAPVRFSNTSEGIITGVETFIFEKTGKKDGTVNIATMVSLNEALPETTNIEQPYAMTASAKVMASGTWVATDDDEVHLNINPSSIVVEVDPDAAIFDTSLLTGADTEKIDSLGTLAAAKIKANISVAVRDRYIALTHLDDVKIKDNRLQYEVGEQHSLMSRQGNAFE